MTTEPGTHVVKTSGDYTFDGIVVAKFAKRSGAVRYVVEDDRGLLFIFNSWQLTELPPETGPSPTEPAQNGEVVPEATPDRDALIQRLTPRIVELVGTLLREELR